MKMRAASACLVLAIAVSGCSEASEAERVAPEPIEQADEPASQPDQVPVPAEPTAPAAAAPAVPEPVAKAGPVTPAGVCDKIKAAVVASGEYSAAQIDGCFPVEGEDPDNPGFYITRLNAVCQQEVCGSVLLGWYAVEAKTGRVFEWDVATLSMGKEL